MSSLPKSSSLSTRVTVGPTAVALACVHRHCVETTEPTVKSGKSVIVRLGGSGRVAVVRGAQTLAADRPGVRVQLAPETPGDLDLDGSLLQYAVNIGLDNQRAQELWAKHDKGERLNARDWLSLIDTSERPSLRSVATMDDEPNKLPRFLAYVCAVYSNDPVPVEGRSLAAAPRSEPDPVAELAKREVRAMASLRSDIDLSSDEAAGNSFAIHTTLQLPSAYRTRSDVDVLSDEFQRGVAGRLLTETVTGPARACTVEHTTAEVLINALIGTDDSNDPEYVKHLRLCSRVCSLMGGVSRPMHIPRELFCCRVSVIELVKNLNKVIATTDGGFPCRELRRAMWTLERMHSDGSLRDGAEPTANDVYELVRGMVGMCDGPMGSSGGLKWRGTVAYVHAIVHYALDRQQTQFTTRTIKAIGLALMKQIVVEPDVKTVGALWRTVSTSIRYIRSSTTDTVDIVSLLEDAQQSLRNLSPRHRALEKLCEKVAQSQQVYQKDVSLFVLSTLRYVLCSLLLEPTTLPNDFSTKSAGQGVQLLRSQLASVRLAPWSGPSLMSALRSDRSKFSSASTEDVQKVAAVLALRITLMTDLLAPLMAACYELPGTLQESAVAACTSIVRATAATRPVARQVLSGGSAAELLMSLFWAQLRERRHSLLFALGNGLSVKACEESEAAELPLLLGGPVPKFEESGDGIASLASVETVATLLTKSVVDPTHAIKVANTIVKEKDSETVKFILKHFRRDATERSSPASVEQWGAAVVAAVLLRDTGETTAVTPCVDGCVRWRSLASDVTGMLIGVLVNVASGMTGGGFFSDALSGTITTATDRALRGEVVNTVVRHYPGPAGETKRTPGTVQETLLADVTLQQEPFAGLVRACGGAGLNNETRIALHKHAVGRVYLQATSSATEEPHVPSTGKRDPIADDWISSGAVGTVVEIYPSADGVHVVTVDDREADLSEQATVRGEQPEADVAGGASRSLTNPLARAVLETCGFRSRRLVVASPDTCIGIVDQARSVSRSGDIPLLVLGAHEALVNDVGQTLFTKSPVAPRAMRYILVRSEIDAEVRALMALTQWPCQVVLLADACDNFVGASYAWECRRGRSGLIEALERAAHTIDELANERTGEQLVPNLTPRLSLRLERYSAPSDSAASMELSAKLGEARVSVQAALAIVPVLDLPLVSVVAPVLGDAALYFDAKTPERLRQAAALTGATGASRVPHVGSVVHDMVVLSQVAAPCTWLHGTDRLASIESGADFEHAGPNAHDADTAAETAERIAGPRLCAVDRVATELDRYLKSCTSVQIDPFLTRQQMVGLVAKVGSGRCTVHTLASDIVRMTPAPTLVGRRSSAHEPLLAPKREGSLDRARDEDLASVVARSIQSAREGKANARSGVIATLRTRPPRPMVEAAELAAEATRAAMRGPSGTRDKGSWRELAAFLTTRERSPPPRFVSSDPVFRSYCTCVRAGSLAIASALRSNDTPSFQLRNVPQLQTVVKYFHCVEKIPATEAIVEPLRLALLATVVTDSAASASAAVLRVALRSATLTDEARALCVQVAMGQEIVRAGRSVASSLESIERLRPWMCALCPTTRLQHALAATVYDCADWKDVWVPALTRQ